MSRVNEFVADWVKLKEELVNDFTDGTDRTEVGASIQAMNLSPDQSVQIKEIIQSVIRDTMYTLLLGLDGAASIGSRQQPYVITDEHGHSVYEPGDLEAEAYAQFHEEG